MNSESYPKHSGPGNPVGIARGCVQQHRGGKTSSIIQMRFLVDSRHRIVDLSVRTEAERSRLVRKRPIYHESPGSIVLEK